MRKLNVSDFNDKGLIQATYTGNSTYLTKGAKYNVCFIPARKKVSVPKSYNPHIHCNYGLEFSLGTFLVEG